MPSAFRRAGAPTSNTKVGASNSLHARRGLSSSSSPALLLGAKGIKPWAGGIHLTSMGLNDLDAILGGGQPLGTCILLQEDRWTRDLAQSLVKYWVAEAISQEQAMIIPVADEYLSSNEKDIREALDGQNPSIYVSRAEATQLLLSLPRNLHWDKQQRRKEQQASQAAAFEPPKALNILEEEEGENEEEEKADEGLEIAWQYRKTIQQERSGLQPGASTKASSMGSTNVFCHSYDLSGRMNEQSSISLSSYIIPMLSSRPSSTQQTLALSKGIMMYRELVTLIKAKEGKAIRLLLFHPDLKALVVALPLLLSYIRKNMIPAVVMVCKRSTADLESWSRLARSVDVVLSTEGFASRMEYPPPAEFRHLQGLLTIAKVSTVTAAGANGGGHFGDVTMSKRPTAFIYGFKRDRRKLHISLLHIPPEDYAEGGGSVGTGVRSGAGKPSETKKKSSAGSGMGCTSNMAGSVLDF